MQQFIYDESGVKLIQVDDTEPVCGQYFCDACGDCLACNGGDNCYSSSDGVHFWVVYDESLPPTVKSEASE